MHSYTPVFLSDGVVDYRRVLEELTRRNSCGSKVVTIVNIRMVVPWKLDIICYVRFVNRCVGESPPCEVYEMAIAE